MKEEDICGRYFDKGIYWRSSEACEDVDAEVLVDGVHLPAPDATCQVEERSKDIDRPSSDFHRCWLQEYTSDTEKEVAECCGDIQLIEGCA